MFNPMACSVSTAGWCPDVLLAVGVALCWSRFGNSSKNVLRDTVALSTALLFASLLTIAAAEIQFHAICCQRHETLRRCWILMGLSGIAIVSVGPLWVKRFRQRSISTPASILLCAGVVVAWHPTPVLGAYRIYGALHRALDQNFQSGFNPASGEMTFLLLPSGDLTYQEQIAPGSYTRNSGNPVYVQSILRFFDKQCIIVRSADEWLGRRELQHRP